MSASLLFTCPNCKAVGNAKPEWIGRKVKCPNCGHKSEIPAPKKEEIKADEPLALAIDQSPTPAPAPPPSVPLVPATLAEAPPLPVEIGLAGEQSDTVEEKFATSGGKRCWEYRVVCLDKLPDAPPEDDDRNAVLKNITEQMNLLGSDGWECVGLISESVAQHRPYVLVAYKRPKGSE